MNNVILMAALIFGADYKEAYEKASLEKEPMVIFVSAEWCQYCKETEPLLKSVYKNYVYLDFDDDNDRVEKVLKISKNRSLPQILFWSRKNGDWRFKSLIGKHNKPEIEDFLEIVPIRSP